MSEIFAYIANFGFPMVISIFLLVRIEARLEQLSASINELAKAILVRPPV
ncbi:putative membrane protein [Propionispora sp. 2/2-37]|nr:YvrJ family protein [Propionispora sp. 2/2-37]CUH94446.1 putative membrane protein [Propionispora sp. 2/2-37]